MSRYIDADTFDDTVQTLNERGWHITRSEYKRMDSVLFEMPTADVVEVKRGKWKREVLGSTSGYGTTVMYQCSECEKMSISQYHYCPNCGARMGEQSNNE